MFVKPQTQIGSPEENAINVLDKVALNEVKNFIETYVRSRKAIATSIGNKSPDEKLDRITGWLIKVSMDYNPARIWTAANIKDVIWKDLLDNSDALEFVNRGASHLVVTSLHDKDATDKLIKAISDGITCMCGDDSICTDAEFRRTAPAFHVVNKAFNSDRWLLFVYYVMRLGASTFVGSDKQ